MTQSALKIIVIRRDNIGDLVCTTPLFTALRAHYPYARICALVNSYNLDVLAGNPYMDAVYAYTKTKHRGPKRSVIGVYLDRLRLFLNLRRENFDYAIIAGAHFVPRALRLARMLKPKHIVGFTESDKAGSQHIDLGIPYTLERPLHETEDIFRLLAPLGISGNPPPLCVVADSAAASVVAAKLDALSSSNTTIAVHISARKPTQRWSAENFIELIRQLHQQTGARFLLLWSPGAANNPLHPGDDEKAAQVMSGVQGLPCLACPTHALKELIAALSLANSVICSDGGAMHLAAALQKPIVCLFGRSDAQRWYPWGVPHKVLQAPSHEVQDITAPEVARAHADLMRERGA